MNQRASWASMELRTSDRHMINATIRLTKKLCKMKYFFLILHHNSYSFKIFELSVHDDVLFRCSIKFRFPDFQRGTHNIQIFKPKKEKKRKSPDIWLLESSLLWALAVSQGCAIHVSQVRMLPCRPEFQQSYCEGLDNIIVHEGTIVWNCQKSRTSHRLTKAASIFHSTWQRGGTMSPFTPHITKKKRPSCHSNLIHMHSHSNKTST